MNYRVLKILSAIHFSILIPFFGTEIKAQTNSSSVTNSTSPSASSTTTGGTSINYQTNSSFSNDLGFGPGIICRTQSFNINSKNTSLNGNVLSKETTTVETYEHVYHDDYGSMLQGEIIISDPLFLSDKWTMNWPKYYDSDYTFFEVDCRIPPSF